ncbi:uncharacterized protein LOC132193552 isoform X2 [Neocloeon triangulifer]|uniref:uncharacterized protein LOC132193552 isoform X2 n=1 Tax=Neocloeon triangulifer TaxID=2078957 RepID=UPI00286F6470|nr:uncharacterized protein LOC132193552 isoform X2 [Neocloeon triangulifer]
MAQTLMFLLINLAYLFVSLKAQVTRNGLLVNRNYNAQEFYCVAQCLGLVTPTKPPKKSANYIMAANYMQALSTTTQTPKAQKIVMAPQVVWGKAKYVKVPFVASKPDNCSALNFVGMDECCRSTPRDFMFSNAELESCSGWKKRDMIPTKYIESVNEYVLNQVQGDFEGPGNIDLSLPSTKIRFGNAICFAECLLKKKGLKINRGKVLNFDKVAESVTKNVSSEWNKIITDAFTDCISAIPVVHPKTRVDTKQDKKFVRGGYRKDTCYTQPFLLIQCVMKSVLLSCPSPNKPLKSAYCDLSRENLRHCDPFKY